MGDGRASNRTITHMCDVITDMMIVFYSPRLYAVRITARTQHATIVVCSDLTDTISTSQMFPNKYRLSTQLCTVPGHSASVCQGVANRKRVASIIRPQPRALLPSFAARRPHARSTRDALRSCNTLSTLRAASGLLRHVDETSDKNMNARNERDATQALAAMHHAWADDSPRPSFSFILLLLRRSDVGAVGVLPGDATSSFARRGTMSFSSLSSLEART